MINRRDVMLGGLAGAAALGFGRVNPDFLMNSAFAAEGKALRFLGAEALSGIGIRPRTPILVSSSSKGSCSAI